MPETNRPRPDDIASKSFPSPEQQALSRGNACISCRAKKRKCDGARPHCSQWAHQQRECIYREVRGPITNLQLRIGELESRISEVRRKISQDPNQGKARTIMRSESTSKFPSITPNTQVASPELDVPKEVTDHLYVRRSLSFILAFSLNFWTCRLDVFFAHEHLFNFPIPPTQFRKSVSLPSSDPTRPHPAVLNSMYLVACDYTTGSAKIYKAYEHTFSLRVTRQIAQLLSSASRLDEYLIARTLLARYWWLQLTSDAHSLL